MAELGKLYTSVRLGLDTGDSSKTLIAAPGTGMKIRIYRILYIPVIQANQLITIATGATTFLRVPANINIGYPIDTGWLNGGILGVAATALIATPASAGPAGDIFVVYTID
jgi:hypothetical protein